MNCNCSVGIHRQISKTQLLTLEFQEKHVKFFQPTSSGFCVGTQNGKKLQSQMFSNLNKSYANQIIIFKLQRIQKSPQIHCVHGFPYLGVKDFLFKVQLY